MVFWFRYMWNARKNFCGENRSKLLVYDEHKAQTSEKVKQILDRVCHTTLALVPPGATSKVQPLDVAFNNEFKRSVDRQVTELIAEEALLSGGRYFRNSTVIIHEENSNIYII